MKTTAERVKDIIAEHLGFDTHQVADDSNLGDDLGADSLDTIEILMAIEEEFDLEISDDDAEEVGLVVKDIVSSVDAAISP